MFEYILYTVMIFQIIMKIPLLRAYFYYYLEELGLYLLNVVIKNLPEEFVTNMNKLLNDIKDMIELGNSFLISKFDSQNLLHNNNDTCEIKNGVMLLKYRRKNMEYIYRTPYNLSNGRSKKYYIGIDMNGEEYDLLHDPGLAIIESPEKIGFQKIIEYNKDKSIIKTYETLIKR